LNKKEEKKSSLQVDTAEKGIFHPWGTLIFPGTLPMLASQWRLSTLHNALHITHSFQASTRVGFNSFSCRCMVLV